MYIVRFLIVIMLAASALVASAQTSDMGDVRRQKTEKQEQIKRTSSQIDSNKKKINSQLNTLRSIEADIKAQERLISSLNAQLDSINRQVNVVNDSINSINERLAKLRNSYANAVRSMHSHSSSFDRLMFVFSASSFHEGYRRMRYLKQFKKWRERNAAEISDQVKLLEAEKAHLENLKKQKSNNLTAQQRAKLELETQRGQQNDMLAQLRRQEKQLRATLAEQQRQADALDRELDRLIAEEQRRAAEEERRRAAEEERRRREAEQRAAAEARQQQPVAQDEGEVVPPKKEPKEEPQPPRQEETRPVVPTLPPAERTFKGSFASNKGRLLFPVTGDYKVVGTFGQHRHPSLKYVKVNNNGIDIEAQPGAIARAIFDGKVSAVFPQDGYHTVVILRHGEYLSIYVNLSEIYVSTGDTLKAGEAIGKVFSDSDDGGRTILHFEVRKERDKLDPLQWVK
ncbi:MAG TPA: peptidoglycan DD-metalloendopeptidase family protein [Candidatus Avimuribaculum pullicola]|nr:peptidoglycan DD-metalloendopeptidase family protein [Candidatus Avimuribaculum pullicola]